MINSSVGLRLTIPKRAGAPRRGKQLVAGPFIGLRDSLDPMVSRDPTRARVIQNLYPLELDKPSTFVGRPGFDQAGSQLGATNKRTGQLVCQFTKLDGTEYTVAIVGGQGIYTYDWSTEAWSQVVTVANLTTASITLSETARCYAVTFTDRLVVSDGINTPWMWDGTSGAGGLAELTNCPALYGQPVVYYAKLFGIKATERNVIVWSEENDPTIGYEAGGYNNAWQLGQTDQEGLYALASTNEALYYFRARSTGAIRGAVTPEFQNDGTREGVDETLGTISPAGTVVRDSRVFFLDAIARPHVAGGTQVLPMWDDIRETLRGVDLNATALANAQAIYDPTTQLVLFGVASTGQSDPNMVLVYNPVLNVPVAVWRGFTFDAWGVVKNADGTPVIMHLSTDGYAYDHGLPTGPLWDDELNAGTTAIHHAVEGCHLGVDVRYEKRFSRADCLIRAEADTTEIDFRYDTPYGSSSTLEGSVESSESRWDEFDWDEAPWASGVIERKLSFGIRGIGRWVRPRLDHQVASEQFGVTALSVDFTAAGDHASAA